MPVFKRIREERTEIERDERGNAVLTAEEEAAVEAARRDDEQTRKDAADAQRLENAVASMQDGFSVQDIGSASERQHWMTKCGLSMAALTRAASAGAIGPYF